MERLPLSDSVELSESRLAISFEVSSKVTKLFEVVTPAPEINYTPFYLAIVTSSGGLLVLLYIFGVVLTGKVV